MMVRVLRRGAWTSLASYLQSNYSLGFTNDTLSSNGGFPIADPSRPAVSVQVDMVTDLNIAGILRQGTLATIPTP
ncbi:MAG: hypothetical protein NTY17_08650 [Planctomycetia bacterium]|nr:hypothetical protein [Planctomycetia bacterium]